MYCCGQQERVSGCKVLVPAVEKMITETCGCGQIGKQLVSASSIFQQFGEQPDELLMTLSFVMATGSEGRARARANIFKFSQAGPNQVESFPKKKTKEAIDLVRLIGHWDWRVT